MTAEASGPTFAGIAADANLLRPLERLVAADPDRVMAVVRHGDDLVEWTAKQTAEQVRAVARGLVACGVEPG